MGKLKPRPDVPDGMKWCRHCEVAKPAADFRPDPRISDGLASWCKACFVTNTRDWRAGIRRPKEPMQAEAMAESGRNLADLASSDRAIRERQASARRS